MKITRKQTYAYVCTILEMHKISKLRKQRKFKTKTQGMLVWDDITRMWHTSATEAIQTANKNINQMLSWKNDFLNRSSWHWVETRMKSRK